MRRGRRLRLAALARLAAGLRDRRRVDRVAAIAVAHEVEGEPVGAPADLALAPIALGHATGRALVLDRAHEHIAKRHERHRLAIGRQRSGAHLAANLLELAVDKPVVRGREGELHRLRADLREIDAPEIAKHPEHGRAAVGRHREAMDVGVLEVGEPAAAVGLGRELGAVEILRAKAAIGDVDELIRRDETRKTVVARELGELAEGSRRRVEHPDIAVVGTGVAAARPRRSAALEEHERAIGRAVRGAAERIVHALGRADRAGRKIERQRIRARGAIEVALDRRLEERDRLPAEGADRAQAEARVEVGELAEVRAIGAHRPEVAEPLAIALEHDPASIGREAAARLDRRIRGQAHRLAARRRRSPKVAAPREDDHRSIGRKRRVAREIDRRSLGHGHRGRPREKSCCDAARGVGGERAIRSVHGRDSRDRTRAGRDFRTPAASSEGGTRHPPSRPPRGSAVYALSRVSFVRPVQPVRARPK